jgi:hypothetical protein
MSAVLAWVPLGVVMLTNLAMPHAAAADQFAHSWGTWRPADPIATTQHPVATASFGVASTIYLFEVAGDSHIWYKTTGDGLQWSSWSTIGAPPPSGTVLSFSPAGQGPFWNRSTSLAAVTWHGELHLFVVGTDDRIYEDILSGGDHYGGGATWSGWRSVNSGPVFFGPAAVVYNDRIYLFYVDNTYAVASECYNCIVFPTYPPTPTWQAPQAIWAVTYAAPSAAVYNGQLHLFAVGTDQVVYDNLSSNATTWSGWGAIPNQSTTGAPVAVPMWINYQVAWLRAIVLSQSGGLNESTLTSPSANWSNWFPLPPKNFLFGASVVGVPSGRLYIFDVSTDGSIWGNIYQ